MDIFAPKTEPAKSIYRAFSVEAAKRDGRGFEQWHSSEINAVHKEAVSQAQKRGLKVPTLANVKRAEANASGSTDYGAKWAYGVVDHMMGA
tara:strand:+ start:2059 stop:2331 length:273 start_codon:yes stop_codon:yes gene_type:complete